MKGQEGSMTPALVTAVSGMRDASLRLDVAAHNIANANTPDFVPLRVDSADVAGGGVISAVSAPLLPAPSYPPLSSGTDLAAELIGLVAARVAFAASAAVASTAGRMQRAALDVLA
jgi:flagellar hook protein FlgE